MILRRAGHMRQSSWLTNRAIHVLGLKYKFFAAITVLTLGTMFRASGHADELTVAGVKIPVTEVRVVDRDSVKIVVGDVAQVLARNDAELVAIEGAFSDRVAAQRYSLNDLSKLVEDLAPRRPAAEKALQFVFDAWFVNYSALASTTRSAALRSLLAHSSVVAFLQSIAISRFTENDPGVELLSEMATADPKTFDMRASGIRIESRAALARQLQVTALSAAALKDFDRATRAGRALTSLGASEQSRAMAVFVQRLKEALDVSSGDESQTVARLFGLYEGATIEAFRITILPFLSEAVHRAAAEAIRAADFGQALSLLAKIPVEKCTPTTHRLLIDTLGSISAQDGFPVLRDSNVAQFLRAWGDMDPAVASSTRTAVVRVGQQIARNDDPTLASVLIAAYRLDADSLDVIRRAQVSGYLARQQKQTARDTASLIQNYSVFDSLRFMARGLYGGILALVCYSISFVLLLALILLRVRGRSKTAARFIHQNEELPRGLLDEPRQARSGQARADHARAGTTVAGHIEDDSTEPISGGFTVDKARMMSPTALEYRKLLSIFGLQPSAPLREIKQAYRAHVKVVHPDLNPNISESGRAQFIELTQSYERLLALREEIGL